jgi:ABC-type nickel/cobalt efflux system permease component RcnA
MQRAASRVLALVIAFALVASAAAWRRCTTLQVEAAVASAAHAGHHTVADHATHEGHAGHAMQHQHGAEGRGQPSHDDHGCTDCCSICTVANAPLPAQVAGMTFVATPAEFFTGFSDWTANTIAVDPGIPKHIV